MKWILLGDCVDSFDEDGNCLIDIFSDVSDFAVAEDASEEFHVDIEDIHIPTEVSQQLTFYINSERGVLFGYDDENDVHYFFCQDQPVSRPALH